MIFLLAGTASFVLFHLALRPRPSTAADAVPPRQPPSGRVERIAVAAIMGAFVAVTARGLTRGLGYDELFTASHFVIGHSVLEAASRVVVLNNHIAYSVLAVLSTALLGPAEWAVRLPALILGAATVYATWRFSRALFGPVTGVAAAAVLAMSPFFVEWSRTARGYTGLTLMAVLASHQFLEVTRTGSPRAAVSHGIALVLAAYFQLFGAWIFVLQYVVFVGLAIRARTSGASPSWSRSVNADGLRFLWRSFLVAAGAGAVLYLPVVDGLVAQVVGRGRVAVRPDFPRQVLDALLSTSSGPLELGVSVLAIAGLLRLRARPIEAAYLAALGLVPFTVMWLLASPFDLYPRFFVYWLPVLACLVAAGAIGLSVRAWNGGPVARALGASLAAAAWVVMVALAGSWIRADARPATDQGYRAALDLPDDAARRRYALGVDAEMFDYYLGSPLPVLHWPADLEEVLRQPRTVVAFHDMSWNPPAVLEMANTLGTRCAADDRGAVVMFFCGAEGRGP